MGQRKKKKLGVSLTMVIAYFICVLVVGNTVAFNYFDLITDQLKQKSYVRQTVGEGEEVDSVYYKSDFKTTKDFLEAEQSYIDEVQKESVVLLQNEGLPLAADETRVTLFGLNSHQKKFASGSGSSGYAADPNGRAIDEAFREAGYDVNPGMFDFYARAGSTSEFSISEIEEEALGAVEEYADAGIVFIGRGGGEGNDIMMDEMVLTDAEKSLVDYSLEHCKKTIVILNTGNQVECGYFADKEVSVVLIGTTGAAGIGAVPQILNGTVNPSGHLVDTYAYDVNTAPATYSVGEIWWEDGSVEYGHGTYSSSYVNYVENIYIGYRYYETRYADVVEKRANVGTFDYAKQVQYPFGHGLSYTEFEYSNFGLTEGEDIVTCTMDVKNVGSLAGKDAVELYMQSPYTQYDMENGIEKSAIELVGFAKTEELAPGQGQSVSIEVSKEVMKTYDANGAGTYVVDAGEYYFTFGNDVHDALNNVLAAKGKSVEDGMTSGGDETLVGIVEVVELDDETYSVSDRTGNEITNQFEDTRLDYYYDDVVYLTRSDWEGTFPRERDKSRKPTQKMVEDSKPVFEPDGEEMPVTGADNGLNLITFKGEDYDFAEWDALLDQVTPTEMMQVFANAGFHTLKIDSVNKPAAIDNDGTNGLYSNFFDGTRPLVFPGEPTLAATWNMDLIKQEGYYISQAILLTGLTGWYAPGANVHRLPCNGRNVDYFSEDPFLAGRARPRLLTRRLSGGRYAM